MMIRWQPTHGDLFTAQTPLFAISVAATVALPGVICEIETLKLNPRAWIANWFKETMDDSRGVCTLCLENEMY